MRSARAGWLLLALFAACNNADTRERAGTGIDVVDDAGHEVHLDTPAQRIVSLIPARTDVLLALGAGDRLIARTRWDLDPSLADLPSLDNALTPSVEWLYAQSPDLVIAWPDGQARTVVTRLRELGIAVYASDVETIADVERAIDHLGTLLGREAAADSLLVRIRFTLDSVKSAVQGLPAVDVAYLVGIEPLTIAGPGTFIDEMLTAAGGRNVFGDAPAKWPMVGLEELLERQPAALIVSEGALTATDLRDQLRVRAGWRDVRAVREGRVHTVASDLVNRPGPSLVQTVRLFADLLHGSGAR